MDNKKDKADEFGIIGRYFRDLAGDAAQVIKGPGDDCAVLQIAPSHELCVSTDTLLEGVHFPVGISADVVAARTVSANLSDLAAMGATPHSFVLALTMPEADEQWLSEFSAALKALMETHHIPLVGGNLAKGPLSLTMTVLGYVPDGETIYRSGAARGDGLYVSGFLGDAGRGLARVLEGNISGYLSERYTHPTPRVTLGQALRDIATAMIDVSDGLVADVRHLASESEVDITIRLEALPLSDELMSDVGRTDALQMALAAGDDYELCFTASQDQESRLTKLGDDLGISITRIGEVTGEGSGLVQVVNGSDELIDAEGYRHF